MTKDVFLSNSRPSHDEAVDDLRNALSSLYKGIRFLDSVPFIDGTTVDLVAADESGCHYLIKVFGDKEPEGELIALAKSFLRLKEQGVISSLKLLIFSHFFSDDFVKFLLLVNIDIVCYEYRYAVSDGKEALFLQRLESEAQAFKRIVKTESRTKPPVSVPSVKIEPPAISPHADLPADNLLDEGQAAVSASELTVLSKEELAEFLKIEEEFKKIFQPSQIN